jgi:hypothetical protein
MNIRLFPLTFAAVLLCAAAGSGADDPLPGRDGEYRFAENYMAGTVWKGELAPVGNFTMRFERNGTICYTYAYGTFRKGTWKQNGDSLHLVIGPAGLTFDAVIRRHRITAESTTDYGLQLKLDLKYVGPISKEEMAKLNIIEK